MSPSVHLLGAKTPEGQEGIWMHRATVLSTEARKGKRA